MLLRIKVTYAILTIICFSTFIHAEENNNQGMYYKAQGLIDEYEGKRHKLTQSLELIEKIKATEPNSKYVWVAYGRISYKAGYINGDKYDNATLNRAKIYFQKAILIDPNFFDAYFYGAFPYLFSQDLKKAKQMIARAAELDRDSAKVDVLFGEIAERENHYHDAIRHAKSAIAKHPDNKILGHAYSLLTSAYRNLNKYEIADRYYRKIINLDPNSAWARMNYSSFVTKFIGDYDEAITQGEIALELMDFGMGHSVLAGAYYAKAAQLHWKKKQYQESIPYYQLAIKHKPSMSNAFYGLGMAYYAIGHKNRNKSQIIQAEEYLDKAIQINPEFEQAIEYLANLRKLINCMEQNNCW